MNECIFLLHIALVAFLVLGAFKIGKEALLVLFCLQGMIANLLIFKQIIFLGLTITCTDAYIIGSYFSLGLLQHHYGKKAAHQAILLSFYSLLIMGLISFLHLLYQPSSQDTYHLLYQQLLHTTPRICLASLAVGLTAQKLSVFLHDFFTKSSLHKIFTLTLPVICAQLYDTVAFSFLGLYGLVHSLRDIILMSYIVKLITVACMTPFILFSKKFYTPKST